MAAPRRVVYVLEGGNTRVRHRQPDCIVAPSSLMRFEVASWDSVWALFRECDNCRRRGDPYEIVEP